MVSVFGLLLELGIIRNKERTAQRIKSQINMHVFGQNTYTNKELGTSDSQDKLGTFDKRQMETVIRGSTWPELKQWEQEIGRRKSKAGTS